ncbi:MAG: UDP-2,3-diacylglucosamine diphosphatase [Pseudomonadota bacterium]
MKANKIMLTVFVSDLHLSQERPEQVKLFFELLAAMPTESQLYVLGDLFEIWLGDDDDTPPNLEIVEKLAAYANRCKGLYVMRGNRDFLYGDEFIAKTGAVLLEDYATVMLSNLQVLLTHGDLLCTKDVKYQAFRQFVRDENNQREFLSHPLAQRRLIAQQTQTGTKASMLEKDDFIMDVEQSTVESVMQAHQVTTLIHGHTHRPADHEFSIDGLIYSRRVLGDWYDAESIVYWQNGEFCRTQAADLINDVGVR